MVKKNDTSNIFTIQRRSPAWIFLWHVLCHFKSVYQGRPGFTYMYISASCHLSELYLYDASPVRPKIFFKNPCDFISFSLLNGTFVKTQCPGFGIQPLPVYQSGCTRPHPSSPSVYTSPGHTDTQQYRCSNTAFPITLTLYATLTEKISS